MWHCLQSELSRYFLETHFHDAVTEQVCVCAHIHAQVTHLDKKMLQCLLPPLPMYALEGLSLKPGQVPAILLPIHCRLWGLSLNLGQVLAILLPIHHRIWGCRHLQGHLACDLGLVSELYPPLMPPFCETNALNYCCLSRSMLFLISNGFPGAFC